MPENPGLTRDDGHFIYVATGKLGIIIPPATIKRLTGASRSGDLSYLSVRVFQAINAGLLSRERFEN
jgi:hypothetical protein